MPSERVRRCLRQVEPGVFVVLDDDELEAAEPEPSRDITMTRFVPLEAIGHAWYDRRYQVPRSPGDGAEVAAVAHDGRDRPLPVSCGAAT